MRRLMLIAVVAFVAACGFTHPGPITPARVTDPNTKVVQRVWYSPRVELWRASQWYRVFNDNGTPSRVVISTDSYACIMPDGDVSDPQPTSNYVCKAGWIRPSNDPLSR